MQGSTCLRPPLRLPPVKSIVRRDVTAPPPRSLPVLLMTARIEFSMLPYVVACPRSMAWMNAKVIAPVDVILDKACSIWNKINVKTYPFEHNLNTQRCRNGNYYKVFVCFKIMNKNLCQLS